MNHLLPTTAAFLKALFFSDQLLVETVHPETGEVLRLPVSGILRHETPHKELIQITLSTGEVVTTTVDHSVFYRVGRGLHPCEAHTLKIGDVIVTVENEALGGGEVVDLVRLPPAEYTYDLSVPGTENFVLSNGVLAHNSYSIGGISLSIDKSAKYAAMKENAESQFEKSTEAKQKTTKFMRGLKQSRFGTGVRSAFGPNVGSGILSPRRFMVWFVSVPFVGAVLSQMPGLL